MTRVVRVTRVHAISSELSLLTYSQSQLLSNNSFADIISLNFRKFAHCNRKGEAGNTGAELVLTAGKTGM